MIDGNAPTGWASLKELAVSETGFIFNPRTGTTFQVNQTGKFILQQLQQGLSLKKTCEALREAFLVEQEDVERDLLDFVYLLRKQELLRANDEP